MSYNISRHSKDGKSKTKLSKNNRWVSINYNKGLCKMTEDEANSFIEKRKADNRYYFLKTLISNE